MGCPGRRDAPWLPCPRALEHSETAAGQQRPGGILHCRWQLMLPLLSGFQTCQSSCDCTHVLPELWQQSTAVVCVPDAAAAAEQAVSG